MRKLFSSQQKTMGEFGDAWPVSEILSVLRQRFSGIEHLGDEDLFSLYGVADRDVRFVVALVRMPADPEKTMEVGFLSRFSGYPLTQGALEKINRNLHLSVASFDSDGDVFLIGGVQAVGEFDKKVFTAVLDAWRRDLMVLIEGLTGRPVYRASPVARSATAMAFAENKARYVEGPNEGASDTVKHQMGASFGQHPDGQTASLTETAERVIATDLLDRFMTIDGSRQVPCKVCGGRGKIGFFARTCTTCNGTGFVSAHS
ncbi:MAG: zinc finger-like domain-containing protein [Pseudomonadota bacterium]